MQVERETRLDNGDFAKLRVEMSAVSYEPNVTWRIRAFVRKHRKREWKPVADWTNIGTIEDVREMQWEIVQSIALREPWELKA